MRIRWRGLELPSQVVCDRSTLTATYGKFVAEPFERGFGTTIGNSLRRILLSSLEGSAVTRVKLHGALHEFTTLPGVVEDVTDIVLNIKSLVVKNHSPQPKVVRVEKNVKGVVTGGDVQSDGQVEVINKDHVIATLTDDVPFLLELVVDTGRGYVPATEHTPQSQEIGVIPVDAAFSPVRVGPRDSACSRGPNSLYCRNGLRCFRRILAASTRAISGPSEPFVQISMVSLSKLVLCPTRVSSTS